MKGYKYTQADGTDWYTGRTNYRAAIGKEIEHPNPNRESKDACGVGFHVGKTLYGAGKYCKPEAIFEIHYLKVRVLGEDEHKVRVSKLKVVKELPKELGYGTYGGEVLAFIENLPEIPWFRNVGKKLVKPTWVEKIKYMNSWAAARDAARDAAWDTAWAAARDAAWAARDAARDAMGAAARAAARDAAGAAAWDAAGAAAWDAAGAAAEAAARDAARDAAWAAARAAARDAAAAAAELVGKSDSFKQTYFQQLIEVYRAGHWPVRWEAKSKTLWVY